MSFYTDMYIRLYVGDTSNLFAGFLHKYLDFEFHLPLQFLRLTVRNQSAYAKLTAKDILCLIMKGDDNSCHL